MTSVADNSASQSPGPIEVFVHASTDKAPLYRAIMRVFVESKDRFVFNLRQQEVFDAIRMAGLPEMPEQAAVESALARLCEWGNLQTEADTTTVSAVEDFYNQRYTFRMTSQGEAAERALAYFYATSRRERALQSSGLADIRLVLQELRQLSRQEVSDEVKIHRDLLLLRALFEDLSATAQTFIGSLERRIDLQPSDARRLIDYAQRFIDELVLDADRIAEAIRDIEATGGLERLLQAVAERSSEWRSHWTRFRIWFISEPGLPSNSDTLRDRVRASVPALLSIVTSQLSHRIDRSIDFRILARWFAQAGSDGEAHLLWRAAFGLCSARHLSINDATLDDRQSQDVPENTSWLNAPPLRISACLRDISSSSRTGGLSRIIDRTAEKEKLAAASHEEAQRLLNAQRRFGTGNRIRLSELEHLETGEFELFLDLLSEAVSTRVFHAEPVEIISGDGRLRIKLEPTGDGREALIPTADGMFSGPDHWISIEQMTTSGD